MKLAQLSPAHLLSRVDKKYPKFKTFRQDPKVKRVALQALRLVACTAAGAALGAFLFSSFGGNMFFIGLGVGIGSGGLIYFAVGSVHYLLKKHGFPANRMKKKPPISHETCFSDENKAVFKDIIEAKMHKKPNKESFEMWKKHHEFSDRKARKFLWKEFQKGFCHGEALSMVNLMHKHAETEKGMTLLNRVKPKDLFYWQTLEQMRADLVGNEAVEKLARRVPDAVALELKSFTREQLKSDPVLLRNSLNNFLKPKKAHKAVAGYIRLEGKDDKNPCHEIFVQFHPKFRFYDSYNSVLTGWYEGFESRGHLLRALQAHLEGYHSKTRPTALKWERVFVQAYLVDYSHTAAIRAGGN